MPRGVFAMHGAGGNGTISGGYGSGGNQPIGNFITMGGWDSGGQINVRSAAGSLSTISGLPSCGGWNDTAGVEAYITAACVATGVTDLIICGFSYGGGGATTLCQHGFTAGGRVRGYIIDDPAGVAQSYTQVNPAHGRRVYHCVPGIASGAQAAAQIGAPTPTVNPYPYPANNHRPMTVVPSLSNTGLGCYPDMEDNGGVVSGQSIASMWPGGGGGGGTTTPGVAHRTVVTNPGSTPTATWTQDFPRNTPAWSNNAWAPSVRTKVTLKAGANTIRLTCPSSSGNGLDFDEISWAPAGGTTTPPPTGTGTGHWEFAANEFKDPQGRRVNLLGFNGPMQQFAAIDTPFIMNMPVTSPPTTPTRTTFTGKHADVQAWGMNSIRVIMNANQSGAVGYAQAIINEYTPLGIVVAFCHLPHQDAGFDPPVNLSGTETQAALNFYRAILAANPTNEYIWCDPGGEVIRSNDGTYWAAFYTAFYNALRAMPGGAYTPMFVTCKGFGQDIAGCVPLWSSFASGKTRVILDWHAYGATVTAAQAQTQFTAIRAANIPFFTQEGGYIATPAGGPPAGFNPGACCGAPSYAQQRSVVLQIIDSWVATNHHSMSWWTACGDDNQMSGHSLRYNGSNNGTYQDFNMPFSEFGQKYWNEGQKSRFY